MADNSTSSGVEHQTYLVLDRTNAKITSVKGTLGNNSSSVISSDYSPASGTHLINGNVLIGQANGHPKSDIPNRTTERTMSRGVDKMIKHQRVYK